MASILPEIKWFSTGYLWVEGEIYARQDLGLYLERTIYGTVILCPGNCILYLAATILPWRNGLQLSQ